MLDRKAQIRSLGSLPLYMTNQGVVESGAAVSEQLASKGISSSELDLVLLSHLGYRRRQGGVRALAGVDTHSKSECRLRGVQPHVIEFQKTRKNFLVFLVYSMFRSPPANSRIFS